MTPLDASTLPLIDVLAGLRAQLDRGESIIDMLALDPDLGAGRYAGERIVIAGTPYVHRSLSTWVELAERLGLRLAMPVHADPPRVRLRLERLGPYAPTRTGPAGGATEKYGAASDFARRSKLEDPGFVLDLEAALARVELPRAPRVLDLGCNTGDELALILRRAPDARITALDHSASALAIARQRFAAATFVEADLVTLPTLPLGTFDLVVSIDTQQSPAIEDRVIVRHVVLELLAPTGSLILGFPNGRYRDGELEYGARMVNFTEPELGLLVKDVAFYRRYLAQHRRRVFVTGKHEVLLTAVPIRG